MVYAIDNACLVGWQSEGVAKGHSVTGIQARQSHARSLPVKRLAWDLIGLVSSLLRAGSGQ